MALEPTRTQTFFDVTTNCEVIVEAELRRDRSLLGHIAEELRVSLLTPECLVWSTIPDSNEARIWMKLAISESELSVLLGRLRGLSGVRLVAPLGPGVSILESLAKQGR